MTLIIEPSPFEQELLARMVELQYIVPDITRISQRKKDYNDFVAKFDQIMKDCASAKKNTKIYMLFNDLIIIIQRVRQYYIYRWHLYDLKQLADKYRNILVALRSKAKKATVAKTTGETAKTMDEHDCSLFQRMSDKYYTDLQELKNKYEDLKNSFINLQDFEISMQNPKNTDFVKKLKDINTILLQCCEYCKDYNKDLDGIDDDIKAADVMRVFNIYNIQMIQFRKLNIELIEINDNLLIYAQTTGESAKNTGESAKNIGEPLKREFYTLHNSYMSCIEKYNNLRKIGSDMKLYKQLMINGKANLAKAYLDTITNFENTDKIVDKYINLYKNELNYIESAQKKSNHELILLKNKELHNFELMLKTQLGELKAEKAALLSRKNDMNMDDFNTSMNVINDKYNIYVKNGGKESKSFLKMWTT